MRSSHIRPFAVGPKSERLNPTFVRSAWSLSTRTRCASLHIDSTSLINQIKQNTGHTSSVRNSGWWPRAFEQAQCTSSSADDAHKTANPSSAPTLPLFSTPSPSSRELPKV